MLGAPDIPANEADARCPSGEGLKGL